MGPDFKQAVHEHLEQYRDWSDYDQFVLTYLDHDRFHVLAEEIEKYISLKNATVLSSGCGTGGCMQAFLERNAARAVGVEVEENFVRLARLRFADGTFENKAQVDLYEGFDLPYEESAFDLVFSMHVLEHTKDPQKYLHEIFRVLKPQGVLFLELPNRYYKIEQHSRIPYIHFPPTEWRDKLIRRLQKKPFSSLISPDTLFKINGLIDFHFPSPTELMDCLNGLKNEFSLKIETAYYYYPKKTRYKRRRFPYVAGAQRKALSFRVIVRKTDPSANS